MLWVCPTGALGENRRPLGRRAALRVERPRRASNALVSVWQAHPPTASQAVLIGSFFRRSVGPAEAGFNGAIAVGPGCKATVGRPARGVNPSKSRGPGPCTMLVRRSCCRIFRRDYTSDRSMRIPGKATVDCPPPGWSGVVRDGIRRRQTAPPTTMPGRRPAASHHQGKVMRNCIITGWVQKSGYRFAIDV